MPPTRWDFPDARTLETDVAEVGADLEPSTLVHAYRHGYFPWPHDSVDELPWFSPDPRGILRPSEIHISRSLRRRIAGCPWTTTVDAATSAVIDACSHAARADHGTWITEDMRKAYGRLHELGWVHSIEVWDRSQLVGGLYGVQVGAVFTGESMFHEVADASKVALVDLAARFEKAGGAVIDVQMVTPHLTSLGAHPVARHRFLDLLESLRDHDITLSLDERPVVRLVP